MIAVPVAAVHEEVHYWAQQQNQERQRVQEMRAMLSEQEVKDSGDQADRRQTVCGKPEVVLRSTHRRYPDYSCSWIPLPS